MCSFIYNSWKLSKSNYRNRNGRVNNDIKYSTTNKRNNETERRRVTFDCHPSFFIVVLYLAFKGGGKTKNILTIH